MKSSTGIAAALFVIWAAAVQGLQSPNRPFPASLIGVSFQATVTHVSDGDTIDVTAKTGPAKAGQIMRIRLDGIDTPEKGRPFSQVATNRTRSIVFDRLVVVRGTDVDRYGRLVARIFEGSEDLSLELVRAGLAWHYICYSNDKTLADAEREARQAKRGFWIDPSIRPPWNCTAPRKVAGTAVGPFKGNVKSKVYHGANCRNASCKNCTVEFKTQEEARFAGYRPAGDCLHK